MSSCSELSKPTKKMTVKVDVQIACEDDGIPDEDTIAGWVKRAVDAAADDIEAEMSLRIVDADEIQALNRDYRQNDKPTNVLSFPAGDFQGLPSDAAAPLGDVVVCASVVSEESRNQGKAVGDHWAHMIVHGTLHLLGFDHETSREARLMESLETRLLTANGLADPYGESPQET